MCRHGYWITARETQHEEARDEYARRSIIDNFRRGLIGWTQAIPQLRETGMYETEIVEALR